MDMSDISAWLDASKTAVELLKAAYPLIPKGEKRDEIEAKVRMAEDILRKSDAKLAKDLGFHLCQCRFPPTPMLWDKDKQLFTCPVDGNTLTQRQVEFGRKPGVAW